MKFFYAAWAASRGDTRLRSLGIDDQGELIDRRTGSGCGHRRMGFQFSGVHREGGVNVLSLLYSLGSSYLCRGRPWKPREHPLQR